MTTPDEYAADLKAALESAGWADETALGGYYAWAPNSLHRGERFHAAIVIASTPASRVTNSRSRLAAVDRLVDDGNLATGKFRLGYRDQPLFVIEH
jgi:general secretion pathway protein G